MRLIKFLIYCVSVLIFSINTINAQTNILNTNKTDKIGEKTDQQIYVDLNDKPLPYGYTSNDDILWSKVVWEVIDLNQKINHPFYYPTDSDSAGTDRLSLFNTLQDNVELGYLKAWRDDYFTDELSKEQVKKSLYDVCIGGSIETVESSEILQFKIKGMWYFDKRQGELKYRLLAIAPLIGFDAKAKCGNAQLENEFDESAEEGQIFPEIFPEVNRVLYWIFYPEARQFLHDSKVFNPDNSVSPVSFDHLLNARRFSSVIVQEENVYGNRKISDYIKDNSLFQLLEADKIKEDIRNREMDMWNY